MCIQTGSYEHDEFKDWTIEITPWPVLELFLPLLQKKNFAKDCIDRETQYTHVLLFETQYTTVDQQKKVCEYILSSGIGNSTSILIYFNR